MAELSFTPPTGELIQPEITNLFMAGYTGRDAEFVKRHIAAHVLGIVEGDTTYHQFNRSTHRSDLIRSGILASLWHDLLDLTPLLRMFL